MCVFKYPYLRPVLNQNKDDTSTIVLNYSIFNREKDGLLTQAYRTMANSSLTVAIHVFSDAPKNDYFVITLFSKPSGSAPVIQQAKLTLGNNSPQYEIAFSKDQLDTNSVSFVVHNAQYHTVKVYSCLLPQLSCLIKASYVFFYPVKGLDFQPSVLRVFLDNVIFSYKPLSADPLNVYHLEPISTATVDEPVVRFFVFQGTAYVANSHSIYPLRHESSSYEVIVKPVLTLNSTLAAESGLTIIDVRPLSNLLMIILKSARQTPKRPAPRCILIDYQAVHNLWSPPSTRPEPIHWTETNSSFYSIPLEDYGLTETCTYSPVLDYDDRMIGVNDNRLPIIVNSYLADSAEYSGVMYNHFTALRMNGSSWLPYMQHTVYQSIIPLGHRKDADLYHLVIHNKDNQKQEAVLWRLQVGEASLQCTASDEGLMNMGEIVLQINKRVYTPSADSENEESIIPYDYSIHMVRSSNSREVTIITLIVSAISLMLLFSIYVCTAKIKEALFPPEYFPKINTDYSDADRAIR